MRENSYLKVEVKVCNVHVVVRPDVTQVCAGVVHCIAPVWLDPQNCVGWQAQDLLGINDLVRIIPVRSPGLAPL
jgi:hypothetical protein